MAMMEIAESQAPLPLISKFFKSPKVCTYRCYDRDGYGGFDCWSVFWMIHNNTNKESSAEKLRLMTEIGAIDDAAEINLKI